MMIGEVYYYILFLYYYFIIAKSKFISLKISVWPFIAIIIYSIAIYMHVYHYK